jgi:putative ABC transport system substrate-binding protein
MRRREFITLLGGAAAAYPLAAHAQEPGRVYRVAFLTPSPRASVAETTLFDELRKSGFIEGQNLEVIPGFGVPNDQVADAAAALVKTSPDVIVTASEPYLRALQQSTRSIPLIGMTEDMVGEGFTASLARPGGNITGMSILSPELDGKRLDILIEAVPGARKIAVFADSKVTQPRHIEALQDAARGRGVGLMVVNIAKRDDVLPAIANAKSAGAEAISFLAAPLFSISTGAFIQSITALRLPTIFQWPENAEEGALIGYGPRFTDMQRERARMVIKVLRGAKPADIPIEQPSKFELVINLKAAKAIGHDVPAGLVLRADKVIE